MPGRSNGAQTADAMSPRRLLLPGDRLQMRNAMQRLFLDSLGGGVQTHVE